MKKLLSIFLFILALPAFSEKTFVHKTKHFDIIYTEEAQATAALIAEKADFYAEEISTKLNKKIKTRMPVYIKSKKELLNGYYTSSPYPRIVLFDTSPTEGQLTNFSDNILKVFYHELTHAISLRHLMPTLPLSFTEGVAVLFESGDGIQGRLNDPLIAHHLMQGRIESTTPSWQEAAGHRDVYPGAFWGYIYGATFADYLQKIYGAETYAKLWKASPYLFPMGKTKKVFGKKLKTLWTSFIESIYFPQEVMLPLQFIEKNNKSGFNILANNKDGFACFDFAKKEVAFFNLDGSKRKLFTAGPSLSNLSFSPDGKFLLVTDLVFTVKGEKSRARIFNLAEKKFLKKEYRSIRYASFLDDKNFCGIEIKNQFSNLILIDTDSFEKKEKLFSVGPGMQYSAIYNPVMAGKNKIAFIAANSLERDILILDILTKEIQKLELGKIKTDLPEQPAVPISAIRYLQTNSSEEEPVLSFSWAGKNMLYRSAIYNVKTKKLKVLNKDISGGSFFPIYFKDNTDEENKIIYIGLHSKYNSIYKINEDKFLSIDSSLKKFIPSDTNPVSQKPNLQILNPQNYNYASWLWKVFVIPMIKTSGSNKLKEIGFGLNLYGIDPTEFLEFKTSSIFYVKPFFYETEIDFRVANLNFSFYDLNSNFKFRKLGGAVKIPAVIPTKKLQQNIFLLGSLSFDAFSFFPKDYQNAKTLYQYKLKHFVLTETVSAKYSYMKIKTKLDTKFFAKDKSGVEVSTGLKHGIHFPSKKNSFVAEAAVNSFTPIVPFNFSAGAYYGYNAYYRPSAGSYTFFNGTAFLGAGSELTKMEEYIAVKNYPYKKPAKHNFGLNLNSELSIFSYEIQTGSSFLPIFYNRINANLGYRAAVNFLGGTKKEQINFFQSLYGKITVDISGLAYIGLEYAHPLEKIKIGKFKFLMEVKF